MGFKLTTTTLKSTRRAVAEFLDSTLLDGTGWTTVGCVPGPGQRLFGRNTIWQVAELVRGALLHGTLVAAEALSRTNRLGAREASDVHRHVGQLVHRAALHGPSRTAEGGSWHNGCPPYMRLGHKVVLLGGHRIHGPIESQPIFHWPDGRSALRAVGLIGQLKKGGIKVY